MAETFILYPTLDDQEVQKNINSSTRFVILPDHLNVNPIGYPNTWEWCKGKKHYLEQMIIDYPNCIFIFDNHPWIDADNVIWFPMTWLDCVMNNEYKNIQIDWNNKRNFTSHYLSGKYRISRVLTNFWLAKKYPIDQLTYLNKPGNNTLDPLIDILISSRYRKVHHLDHKKYLEENWLPRPDGLWNNNSFFTNKLYKHFHSQSYLSILPADNNIEISTTTSEKIFQALVSGVLILHLGNYKVHHLLKNLGFEIFDNFFDFDHLDSTDRYNITIGGLESNKNKIIDHQIIENQWFENQKKLKFNHKLCLNRKYWLEMFEEKIKIVKKSLSLSLSSDIPDTLSWIS